jgi:subtilase family serine protease
MNNQLQKNKFNQKIAKLLQASFALILLISTPILYLSPVRAQESRSHRRSCWASRVGVAECNAHVLIDASAGQPLTTSVYANGYNPTDLASAYNLPALPIAGSNFNWNGKVVVIVDAFDNPNVSSDLLAYRKQFNLPLCSTTNPAPTTNDLIGCLFSKVNQSGLSSPTPVANIGWGQEIDLDVDMVAATCPNCKILLIEASSNYFSDLGAAVDRAALMGANSISNSYGGSEFSGENTVSYNGHFNHPGVAITVSAGDSGYGTSFPAASQYVTAVGGTSLTKSASTRGWNETVWPGTGSGCSRYIPRLNWQPRIGTCSNRVIADVSAVADPYTGVAVYDSFGSATSNNWYVFGGTSVAAPVIASVYAESGNAGGLTPGITYGEYPYTHTTNLNDVVTGSNGRCSYRFSISNKALCTAEIGFDGPSGLGTPKGLLAF